METAIRPARNNLATLIAPWIAVSCSLVLALGLAELLVRMFAPQITYRHPVGLFQADRVLGFSPKARFDGVLKQPEFRTRIQTNNIGQRNSYDVDQKSPQTVRVLVIGDSFTAAYAVNLEQTWTEVLAKQLEQLRPTHRVEVLNAGVPGYNTIQEVRYLETVGLGLEPDLVALGFFVGNDIEDNAKGVPDWIIDRGYLRQRELPHGILPFAIRSFIAKNSQLYHLLWPTFRTITNRVSGIEGERPETAALAIYASEAPSRVRTAWDVTNVQLDRFAQLTRGHSIPGVVIGIPDGIQVGAPRTVAGRALPATFPPGLDATEPNRRLASSCSDLNIPFFDLLEPLRAHPDPGSLYFPLDGHWTVAGNRVVGETLAPLIAKRIKRLADRE